MKYTHKITTYPKKHKKTSVKIRWVLSCTSLSLIPILIGCLLFFVNVHNFKEQTLQNNESLLLQIRSLTDQGLYDARTIALNLSSDPQLTAFSQPRKTGNVILKRRLMEKLELYCGYNSYIRDIYVYFWDSDEFVTNKTTASPSMLYYTAFNNPNMPYEDFRSMLRSQHHGTATTLPCTESLPAFMYFKTFPEFPSEQRFTVLVRLDAGPFLSMAGGVGKKTQCELNFILPAGKSVLPFSQPYFPNSEQSMYRSVGYGISRFSAKDGVTFSLIPSETLELTYLLATPRTAYYSGLRPVNVIFLLSLFGVILGSAVLTANFIYRNYVPLREIVELVRHQQPDGASTDEYTMIKSAILCSNQSSAEMRDQLNRQETMLLDAMLALAMHNSSLGLSSGETFERLNGCFHYPLFSVALVRLHMEDTEVHLTGEQSRELENLICEEVRLGEGLDCWVIEADGGLLMLFNLEKERGTSWGKQTDAFVSRLQEAWRLRQRETLLLCISRCYEGLQSIPTAYDEAEYSLRYRQVFGTRFSPSSAKKAPLLRSLADIIIRLRRRRGFLTTS